MLFASFFYLKMEVIPHCHKHVSCFEQYTRVCILSYATASTWTPLNAVLNIAKVFLVIWDVPDFLSPTHDIKKKKNIHKIVKHTQMIAVLRQNVNTAVPRVFSKCLKCQTSFHALVSPSG